MFVRCTLPWNKEGIGNPLDDDRALWKEYLYRAGVSAVVTERQSGKRILIARMLNFLLMLLQWLVGSTGAERDKSNSFQKPNAKASVFALALIRWLLEAVCFRVRVCVCVGLIRWLGSSLLSPDPARSGGSVRLLGSGFAARLE